MIKVFSISLLLSLMSLIITVALPVNISEQSSKVGPSPYRVQIDEFYSKTSKGLPPDAPEWKQLEDLRRKNNEWFEEGSGRLPLPEDLKFFEVLKMKSSKVAPILMLFWSLCFYFLFRSRPQHSTLFILVFPALFFVVNLISFLTLIFIFSGILSVYVISLGKENRGRPRF